MNTGKCSMELKVTPRSPFFPVFSHTTTFVCCRLCMMCKFTFFLHAHEVICASVDVKTMVGLAPLTLELLNQAMTSKSGLKGVIPWGAKLLHLCIVLSTFILYARGHCEVYYIFVRDMSALHFYGFHQRYVIAHFKLPVLHVKFCEDVTNIQNHVDNLFRCAVVCDCTAERQGK